MRNKLSIGLFGFGVVGTGLYEVLNKSQLLDARIAKIVVKNKNKSRQLDASYFSFDKEAILDDPSINMVVELINDSEAAFDIVSTALKRGKHVVSANKKLIAEHFEELIALAKDNGVSFLYEAAVGGSIPIIRNLEEYYNNDTLSAVQGIVNGTTNYILTQANSGIAYAEALQKAQELGFAEIDPTLDVDGFDSKFKLVLLMKHAFGIVVNPNDVFNCGIRQIKHQDVRYATEKGYRIKLFSHAEKVADGIVGFVAPHFVTRDHFAYQVNNEFNAVVVEAAFSDKQLFIGKGAGSYPTASAVLSDISALQFDYSYEYKKTLAEESTPFTQDFYVAVYVGSTNRAALNKVPLQQIDEVYQGKDYNYETGWLKFSNLIHLDLNNEDDLSVILLPEGILSVEAFEKQLNIAEPHAKY